MDIETENKIIALYASGKSARSIDRKLKLSNSTSSKIIKKNNIKIRAFGPEYISTDSIKCSICGEVKDISQYSLIRKGEYVLNYCNNCRNKKKSDTIEKYISRKVYERCRRSKSKNIPFSFTKESAITQLGEQGYKCFYSGEDMIFEYGLGQLKNSCSMDRIIPNLGYVEGNVVFCANRFNIIKNDLTMCELKKYIPTFYEKIYNKIINDNILKEHLCEIL